MRRQIPRGERKEEYGSIHNTITVFHINLLKESANFRKVVGTMSGLFMDGERMIRSRTTRYEGRTEKQAS